ncbi:P0432B10.19 [Oryza sativa Japonica Group]|uniref:p0432B10.19 protein n=1 Tax=Oryza sativa subsp. japonica TaxID=39947 RepID=Q8RZL0_ORYSJ|nr:P0432B10.19 [Oryza sativa Japonica Group]
MTPLVLPCIRRLLRLTMPSKSIHHPSTSRRVQLHPTRLDADADDEESNNQKLAVKKLQS